MKDLKVHCRKDKTSPNDPVLISIHAIWPFTINHFQVTFSTIFPSSPRPVGRFSSDRSTYTSLCDRMGRMSSPRLFSRFNCTYDIIWCIVNMYNHAVFSILRRFHLYSGQITFMEPYSQIPRVCVHLWIHLWSFHVLIDNWRNRRFINFNF